MRDFLARLGILISTLLPSRHILPRHEGRIWTEPQDSTNGSFIFPRTFPLTFREGSSINISWSTKYENINLYFYQRGKVANSVQLVTNLATKWYQWEVRAEETNLTNPFVFRVVNAQGTAVEQNIEGFWSTSWFLTRDESDDTTKTVISSLSSIAASSTPTATSFPTSSLSSSTTSSTEPSSTTLGTNSDAAASSNSRVHKETIIGLTVGLVIAGATLIAGLLYYLRKRRKSRNVALSAHAAELPAESYHDDTNPQKQLRYQQVHEAFVQPSELQGVAPQFELPGQR